MPVLPTPGVTTPWGGGLNAAIESLHLQGTHAARPATDLATGTLYSCSDHALIYRWNGTAWATWAAALDSSRGVTVRRSAGLSIPSGAVTAVTWTDEVTDTDGYHSTVTNTERLTVPAGRAGKYLITLTGELAGASSSSERSALVRKSTGEYLTIDTRQGVTTALQRYALSVVEPLVVGDYVTASVYQTTGFADTWRYAYSDILADGYIKFSMYRIGD